MAGACKTPYDEGLFETLFQFLLNILHTFQLSFYVRFIKVCSESLQSSLTVSARSLYLQMKAINQVKGNFAKLLEKHPRLILALVQNDSSMDTFL